MRLLRSQSAPACPSPPRLLARAACNRGPRPAATHCPPAPANAYLRDRLGAGHGARLVGVKDMPKGASRLSLDFSSLLGPLFSMWLLQARPPACPEGGWGSGGDQGSGSGGAVRSHRSPNCHPGPPPLPCPALVSQLMLPVGVHTLVAEKEQHLRLMMKMQVGVGVGGSRRWGRWTCATRWLVTGSGRRQRLSCLSLPTSPPPAHPLPRARPCPGIPSTGPAGRRVLRCHVRLAPGAVLRLRRHVCRLWRRHRTQGLHPQLLLAAGGCPWVAGRGGAGRHGRRCWAHEGGSPGLGSLPLAPAPLPTLPTPAPTPPPRPPSTSCGACSSPPGPSCSARSGARRAPRCCSPSSGSLSRGARAGGAWLQALWEGEESRAAHDAVIWIIRSGCAGGQRLLGGAWGWVVVWRSLAAGAGASGSKRPIGRAANPTARPLPHPHTPQLHG